MNGNTKYQGKVLKGTFCSRQISRKVLIEASTKQSGGGWRTGAEETRISGA